jgi:hypothetical protein
MRPHNCALQLTGPSVAALPQDPAAEREVVMRTAELIRGVACVRRGGESGEVDRVAKGGDGEASQPRPTPRPGCWIEDSTGKRGGVWAPGTSSRWDDVAVSFQGVFQSTDVVPRRPSSRSWARGLVTTSGGHARERCESRLGCRRWHGGVRCLGALLVAAGASLAVMGSEGFRSGGAGTRPARSSRRKTVGGDLGGMPCGGAANGGDDAGGGIAALPSRGLGWHLEGARRRRPGAGRRRDGRAEHRVGLAKVPVFERGIFNYRTLRAGKRSRSARPCASRAHGRAAAAPRRASSALLRGTAPASVG